MGDSNEAKRYRWATWGDLNAFFGLFIDFMTDRCKAVLSAALSVLH